MADVTKITLARNAKTTITATNGATSQTVVYDREDEKIVLYFVNTDAAPCRVKIQSNGFGGKNAADLNIDIAASGEAATVVESMYYKDPATQAITLQVLNQNDTTFSGTVTNVKFRVIALPKGIIN